MHFYGINVECLTYLLVIESFWLCNARLLCGLRIDTAKRLKSEDYKRGVFLKYDQQGYPLSGGGLSDIEQIIV